QRGFNWKTAADIQRINFRSNFFQTGVNAQTFVKLVPVIRSVFDAGIDEKMQHFEARVRVFSDFLAIIRDDIFVTNAKSGGIKFELWFFFGSDSDSDVESGIYAFGEFVELAVII